MGKPGPTQDIYAAPDDSQVRHAGEIAKSLEKGSPVSAENVYKARDTLLGALRTKSPESAKWIGRSLRQIYVSSTDAQDQAELLGHLVAIGTRARPVFDEIEGLNHPTLVAVGLTESDLRALKDSLPEGQEQRLSLILGMLRRRGPNRMPREPEGPKEADLSGRGARRLRKENEPIDLGDHSLPKERRLDAALRQGEGAIQDLANLLENPNPAEREFACVALIHLARTTEDSRHKVLQKMRLLEAEPTLRPTAEFIRRQVEGMSTETYDAARAARDAGIHDGWLRRAVASCDPLSIRNAAAGREAIAMPLILRELVAPTQGM